MQKYTIFNNKNLTEKEYFSYDNVKISDDKTEVYLNILKKDKEKQTIINTIPVIYNVETADNCNKLDYNCIVL
jgi:hypothetical protein